MKKLCSRVWTAALKIAGLSVIAAAAAIALQASAQAQAQAAPVKIDMVVFGQPSLGAFLTPVIKQRKLDIKHGIDFNFVERTPDAYIAQFNSGEFQVGGSAALLSVGVASNQGVKVSYLFNLFDYFGAVVTDRPDIKTVKDLEGHQLVAASATTNYAMFKWVALNQGVNFDKISVQNTATPGLVGYALADRAEAVQLWEPAYSILISKKPSLHAVDLDMKNRWKKFSGTDAIPYLGVAAHDDWIKKNPQLVDKMYATFKEAADWLRANPAEGAKLVAASIKGSDEKVIRQLIEDNSRLGLNVQTAADMKKGIEAVYAAGVQSKYLSKDVDKSTIYTGIRK
ncbi:MAG TPA: ABC transporter substrate-binding protein [Herbaspirillum sp.]|jgi:NitT/TauT family transport system substrate-binding protein